MSGENAALRRRVVRLERLLKSVMSNSSDTKHNERSKLHQNTESRFLSNEQQCAWIENGVWSNLCDELDILEEETFTPRSDIVFGVQNEPLRYGQYPPDAAKLWTIYVRNVDPLSKIIHIPTMTFLLDRLKNDEGLSRSQDALFFACWYAAVLSLDEETCLREFSSSKITLLAQYKHAAEQALIRTDYLNTLSLESLTALVVYLMGDPASTLSAVAVHIGRRLGIHKDGTALKLCQFETTMRKRLWWQIIQIDVRACELSGMVSQAMLYDLDALYAETDAEFAGVDITGNNANDLHFVQLRCFVAKHYRALYTEKKDSTKLQEFESLLQQQYFAADPLDSLQFFTSLAARAILASWKSSSSIKSTDSTKLEYLIKSIEYDNLMLTDLSVKQFHWHARLYFQYHIFLALLQLLSTPQEQYMLDDAWQQVQKVYDNRPELYGPGRYHTLIRKLTLKAWDGRVSEPEFIQKLKTLESTQFDHFIKGNDDWLTMCEWDDELSLDQTELSC